MQRQNLAGDVAAVGAVVRDVVRAGHGELMVPPSCASPSPVLRWNRVLILACALRPPSPYFLCPFACFRWLWGSGWTRWRRPRRGRASRWWPRRRPWRTRRRQEQQPGLTSLRRAFQIGVAFRPRRPLTEFSITTSRPFREPRNGADARLLGRKQVPARKAMLSCRAAGRPGRPGRTFANQISARCGAGWSGRFHSSRFRLLLIISCILLH